MHFAGGYLGCGDDLMFVINTSVNLIFKLGSDFVPAGDRSIRDGRGGMLFISSTGFSNATLLF